MTRKLLNIRESGNATAIERLMDNAKRVTEKFYPTMKKKKTIKRKNIKGYDRAFGK